MPLDGGTIAAQVGAAQGLWTHTPVDWRGNETGVAPPGPAGWPSNASDASAVFPNGSTAVAGGLAVGISAVSVTAITATTATVNFTLSGTANWRVDYGTTTAYGLSTTGSGTGALTSALSSLTTVTPYFYRVNATPTGGQTSSSGQRTFTTV